MYKQDKYQQIIFKDNIIDIYDGVILRLECIEKFSFGQLGTFFDNAVLPYNNSTLSSPILCIVPPEFPDPQPDPQPAVYGTFLIKGIIHISSVSLFNSTFYSYFENIIEYSVMTPVHKLEHIFPIIGYRIDKNTLFFNPTNYVYDIKPTSRYVGPVPYCLTGGSGLEFVINYMHPVTGIDPELSKIFYKIDNTNFVTTFSIISKVISKYKYVENVLLEFYKYDVTNDGHFPIEGDVTLFYSKQYNLNNNIIIDYSDIVFDDSDDNALRIFVQDNFGTWHCALPAKIET